MPRKTSSYAAKKARCVDPFIGRRIRSLRQARKLTLAQLAKSSGLAYRTVQDYENGLRLPGIRSAVLLARGLMVDLPDLCFLPLDLSGEDFAALPVDGTGGSERS